MALALTERVHSRELAEALQLIIEYDPRPPFNSGSPGKADASTQRLAKRILLGDRPVQMAARITQQVVSADSAAPAAQWCAGGRIYAEP
jgi:hypothetical protein